MARMLTITRREIDLSRSIQAVTEEAMLRKSADAVWQTTQALQNLVTF